MTIKIPPLQLLKELGIAEEISEIMIGTELDNISDTELANKIDRLHVFARVSPEHKVKIVKSITCKRQYRFYDW